jgi:hypothetical protein
VVAVVPISEIFSFAAVVGSSAVLAAKERTGSWIGSTGVVMASSVISSSAAGWMVSSSMLIAAGVSLYSRCEAPPVFHFPRFRNRIPAKPSQIDLREQPTARRNLPESPHRGSRNDPAIGTHIRQLNPAWITPRIGRLEHPESATDHHSKTVRAAPQIGAAPAIGSAAK